MSQAGQARSSGGTGGGITTINGDTGSITGPVVTIKTGVAGIEAGSTVKFVNSGTTSYLRLNDALGNTMLGGGSGNATISGTRNAAASAAGLTSLTSGNSNFAFGYGALNLVTTGSYNICIGESAGQPYTSSESSNIIIGSSGFPAPGDTPLGTAGDNNTLRIGRATGSGAAQLNRAFIQGIAGVTVANTALVTIDTSTGQMGSTSYAQGTWTPGISFGGGITGITYTTQSGTYTRIGNTVVVGFQVQLSNKGSSTGVARITGLPITSGANALNFGSILIAGSFTNTVLYTSLGVQVDTSTTTLQTVQYGSGQSVINASDTNFGNTTYLTGTVTYTTG